MKPIYFVSKEKPVSYNAKNKTNKNNFEASIKNEFLSKYSSLYDNLPIDGLSLKTCVTHICGENDNIADIDNLSKPIVDAFRGVIYRDDSLIIQRNANRIQLKDFDFATVDATNIPLKILNDLHKYFNDSEKNIIFFGVDTMNSCEIKVGII